MALPHARVLSKAPWPGGFTLIELLIVIAIIAILALIAVPNFLEAQTRAKVSRCYADQRSLATATEMYAADIGRPFIGFNEGGSLGLWTDQQDPRRGIGTYASLTTPVAYMTNVPQDPFIETTGHDGIREWRCYFYEYFNPDVNYFKPAASMGYTYLFRSWGPMRKGAPPWEAEMINRQLITNVYDPTNGTTTWGFILTTNKGVYRGPGT